MLKAYKYRLYPSLEQMVQMEHHFGCCRLVWNLALEVKSEAWRSARKKVSRYELQVQLKELKQAYTWLYDVNSQSLQSVLLNLDHAFEKLFNGSGFPQFKKKAGRQSFQCPQHIKIEDNIISLPIIKKVRCEGVKPFEGRVKTVTVSKTPTGKYYASILVDNKKELPSKPQVKPETTLGMDLGIKSFVITSDGRTFEPNRYLKNSLQRLKCLQRRASRKKKGSKNRKKANLRVAKLHEKIANQRSDYIHKTTKQLICDSQAESFVIENLNVVGMLKNRRLSGAISDASFSEFVRQMKYKCVWYGKNLIQIGRFEPSSKMCSGCREINQKLRLQDRQWECAHCGAFHDRDLNAAKNIKEFGLKKSPGVGSSGGPVESRLMRTRKQAKYFVEQVYNYQWNMKSF